LHWERLFWQFHMQCLSRHFFKMMYQLDYRHSQMYTGSSKELSRVDMFCAYSCHVWYTQEVTTKTNVLQNKQIKIMYLLCQTSAKFIPQLCWDKRQETILMWQRQSLNMVSSSYIKVSSPKVERDMYNKAL
jgi:hypothetical protein